MPIPILSHRKRTWLLGLRNHLTKAIACLPSADAPANRLRFPVAISQHEQPGSTSDRAGRSRVVVRRLEVLIIFAPGRCYRIKPFFRIQSRYRVAQRSRFSRLPPARKGEHISNVATPSKPPARSPAKNAG